MTTDGPSSPTIQPELPLDQPATPAGSPPSGDWRLDARTRAIGRQGVAAARALLAGPPGSGGGRPDDGTQGADRPIERPEQAGGRRGRAA